MEYELGVIENYFKIFKGILFKHWDQREVLHMEKELKKSGKWSTARAVVIITVVGILSFVFFAHDILFYQFIALITGVVAALPYIFSFGSIFSQNSNTNLQCRFYF